jgi:DNA-binding transcriptional MerR regulator
VTETREAPLPSKLYYRIGEVAELVGVEPHVLRYWEREFRSIRPTKSAKGQRVYSRRDVENLMRVRELLYREGFTIAGARKKLQRSGAEPADAQDRAAPAAGRPMGAVETLTSVPRPMGAVETLTSVPRPMGAVETLTSVPRPMGAVETLTSAVRSIGAADVKTSPASSKAREQLVAIRTDIEAFLAELGTP